MTEQPETPDRDWLPTPLPTDTNELAALIDHVETTFGGSSPQEDELREALYAQVGGDKAYSLWVHAGRIVDAERYTPCGDLGEGSEILPDEGDNDAELPAGEPARTGVTAGYDPETDAWHVEIHTGRSIEIVPIAAPQIPDEQAARSLAEQIAEHRELAYVEENKLHTAECVLEKVREAAGMGPEDDPSLLEWITHVVKAFNSTAALGLLSDITEPTVMSEAPNGNTAWRITDIAAVMARPGVVGVTVPGKPNVTPALARHFALTLLTAANVAEALHNTAVAAVTMGDAR